MVRVNLVPKRVQKRVWPPREPYREFKIKTLLPEQKAVKIKKKKRTSSKNCDSYKKNKKIYRLLGKNFLKNE